MPFEGSSKEVSTHKVQRGWKNQAK